MDCVGWYNSGCGALQYPAGIKINTRAMVVYSQNSNITVQGTPQHLAGIKINTHNAIIKQRGRDTTIKGALQHLAGIKNNTRAVDVV